MHRAPNGNTLSLALALLVCTSAVRGADAPTPAEAVRKALPLLVKGAKGHTAENTCFACHNQSMALLALTTARDRGFGVDDKHVQQQLQHIHAFLESNRSNYLKGRGQGGQALTAGYALLTLEWGGWKPDAVTRAVVEYLLAWKKDVDHYTVSTHRPPSESGSFASTYVALRGLNRWGQADQRERIALRVEKLKKWLLSAPARDTEDRVFRLWGLAEAGVKLKERATAVEALQKTQHADGGWGQLDGKDSDAYATGSALVALGRAGGVSVTDRVYQRGLAYLLKTQQPDGSWLVRTRSRPIQKYYESGFPHGKHQFISMAATGWATTALALACPDPTKKASAGRGPTAVEKQPR